LQGSLLAHILKKPNPIILRSQDLEVIAFEDKLQADLGDMKLKKNALEKKLQEQHQESIRRRGIWAKDAKIMRIPGLINQRSSLWLLLIWI